MINGYGEICRIKLKIKSHSINRGQLDMFHNNIADYEVVTFQDNILVINDLDLGNASLTNSMADVVKDLSNDYDFTKVNLIYKDSMGIYDAVIIKDGNFDTFAPISESNLDKAIEKFKLKYAKSWN
jgi:hypothetical protein